jgi:hypothetical protein
MVKKCGILTTISELQNPFPLVQRINKRVDKFSGMSVCILSEYSSGLNGFLNGK